MGGLLCPRCATDLRAVGTQAQAHACPRDHGLFLPQAELARHFETEQAEVFRRAIHNSPVPGDECPRCRVEMREIRFSDAGFRVDGCARCGGFWFDAGELQAVRDEQMHPRPYRVPDIPDEVLRIAGGVVLGNLAFAALRRS